MIDLFQHILWCSLWLCKELTAINSVTRHTSKHPFNITGICLSRNMSAILHIYVPMHFFPSLHIDPTLLHTSVKNQLSVTFIFHSTVELLSGTNMPPKCQNVYHMPKLLKVHQWGKCANIYATYEVTPTDDVASHCTQMTMRWANSQLHILSLPLGQISQNDCNSFLDFLWQHFCKHT